MLRKASYLLAAAAISGLALAATPSSASPLASGLATTNTALPVLNEGLVQKVHGWHCKRKFSNRRGWHRHRKACRNYDYYDDYYDDDYYDYGYYPRYRRHYGYPGYGFGVPFFSFGFGGFGGHHGHHHWKH
jgi:hypothetical protein